MNPDSYVTPNRPIRPVALQSDHDTITEQDAQPEEDFRERDTRNAWRAPEDCSILDLAHERFDNRHPPLLEFADERLAEEAQREEPPGDPSVFAFDTRVMRVEKLWEFISANYPLSRLQGCAEELMAQVEPYRRPFLCMAILESTEVLPKLLVNPNHPDLKKALYLMNLGKFAAEQWIALHEDLETPAPKRRRPE